MEEEFKMKNVARILFVIAVLVAAVSLLASCKDGKDEEKGQILLRYYEPDDQAPYFEKVYENGDSCDQPLKVMTFSDTHLKGDVNSDTITRTIIERTIVNEKPDLIVITGDICLGKDAETHAIALCELFESHNQYWAVALGNHDGEHPDGPTREELINLYASYPHCLAKSGPSDIWGYGNYIINYKYEGKIAQTLIFMDSGLTKMDKEICDLYGYKFRDDYDFIKPNQIDWYKQQIDIQTTQNGGVVPTSTLFIHIPLPEYKKIGTGDFIHGFRLEPECSSPVNSGMFDAILEKGSTKTVICGHDHSNDFCGVYKGVKLMYSQQSSFGSYFTREPGHQITIALFEAMFDHDYTYNDGHTVLEMNIDGSVTVIPMYNEYIEGIFDGLEEEIEALEFSDTINKK